MRAALLTAFLLLGAAALAHGQSSTLPPGTSGAEDTPAAPAPKAAVGESSPLDAAEAKLDARQYPEARSMLQAYLSAHPADARALFDLGYAEDASGDGDAAETSYRKATVADPRQFEARAALGLLLATRGKQADAATELAAAAKLTPNPANPSAQAQANRALARLLAVTDPQGARKALIAALQQSPETTADTLLAADIAGRAGDADAAADAYGKVLSSAPAGSPQQSEASAGLAHLLIQARRYSEAEPVLRKALIADPQSPALNSELADVLSQEGKKQDAVAVLENLHAAKPDDGAVTTMLADLYMQTGAAAKADPLYEQLLAAHPHDPALLAEHGDALVRAGRFEEAMAPLEEATRLNPGDGNAWSSLAFAANQTHQPQVVLNALAMRSKVMNETPATYFLSATAYDSLHQTKRAVELYRQFLSVAGTGFPDEVWQAKHRLVALAK